MSTIRNRARVVFDHDIPDVRAQIVLAQHHDGRDLILRDPQASVAPRDDWVHSF